jgi:hypothetical protein
MSISFAVPFMGRAEMAINAGPFMGLAAKISKKSLAFSQQFGLYFLI